MSKVKKSGKSHYELLYIIPNKFTEEEAKGIDAKVQKTIAEHEGEITYSEDWGSKKMAYSIKGFNHGYYKLHEFDLSGDKLNIISNLFRLNSELLRHQIVKVAKRTPEQIKKEKEAQKKALLTEKEEAQVEEKITEEKKTEEKIEEEKKESFKKKVDLKDLDKKLDDILDSSDLL